MTGRQNDRLTIWQVWKWQASKMTDWKNDRLTKWQVDKMTGWQNDRLTKWQVDKMTGRQNDRLTKWHFTKCQLNIMTVGQMSDCWYDV